ncbi:efflux RND transporter permease subunit [Aquipseudomonas alcaligenes]|uniref:Efflux pump membrane transporter n=1 Tax=Aquipseudomonas alcaligenes TaxID=43263 RepID=A0AA37CEV2_AQUAC|nr:multidrug efflux RND transporter permease subunit [Pseudomonas alcaligenes]BCR25826.1 multidrug efflux RND transporter permease subunit [Pseudomonas alcaligenes]GIZ66375.1 multidrug efflux RND transporter permease subunit [Pseudomonas alcaligenes]GIZ70708.1 multidrug efflux RND transporter permease subunit [Pseudomonas alcaligenes]GIZ75062.1 multidrug efflux RND transporter permease subunit [Pseudomonas alcaligenes]GIZ79389.1 multidrug efflux RND transporter permease subunit [Pseudomonas al
MISRFFIDRPVFAAVISIVILLGGLAAMTALPIAQYPQILPPQVSVTASYPGASAQVIAETVAAPLEQQINGVEGMIYQLSNSASSGSMSLSVYFEVGRDPDQATIDVNNRVQAALAKLPEEVRRQGVKVEKKSSDILQVVTLYSPDNSKDPVFISNYALINVIDELKRLPGVGDVSQFGSKNYSMRIWLRPDKLAQYDLTPTDVVNAIREQNSQFAAGSFGQQPLQTPQDFTYTVTTQGRFKDPKEFESVILRSDATGASLRLGDVARIELGAQDYSLVTSLNGQQNAAFGVYLQPGANALDTAESVRAAMERLAQRFPEGITYKIPYDTTKFVQISIDEVIKTFFEALLLVVLVVFVFLQNWRATLIPVLAIPVSLVGTFAGMYALGFSINLLTLFGLVLAIGIVVDDAIVVIENVERVMRTKKLNAREAAIEAMEEVTGPIIAIVLVLCAVFVPVGFLGGLAGEMYKQFAITIAVSVVISGIVALTLSPALCALMLKPDHSEPAAPFRAFNRFFDKLTDAYGAGVAFFLKRSVIGLLLFGGMIAIMAVLFTRVPGSLVPDEDQGYVINAYFLPPAASVNRTDALTHDFTEQLMQHPAVEDVVTFAGFDVLTFGQRTNAGVSFVPLKDWSERTTPELDARNLTREFMGMGMTEKDGVVMSFNPPPISGMSTTGGFEGYIQDRSGGSVEALAAKVQAFLAAAAKRPELGGVQSTFSANVPQYYIDLDRTKARALGVTISDVFTAMQSTFGSYYVNDFTLYGRTWQVSLQSESEFRRKPEDLSQVYVRSSTTNDLVPLTSLIKVNRILGPDTYARFNVYPSAKFLGGPAPGYSSGQALAAIQEVADEVLGSDYTVGWVGSAYQELATQGSGSTAFVFGLIMVFLILAAQYERWTLPLAVVTAVPFAVFGAILAVWLRGIQNDVYFQVGLITLIGLAAKNAILIVEFAVLLRAEGKGIFESAYEAAKLRFRPIVMTSLAFILGCVPLAISSGAGSASRHSIGTGVIGGMLAATLLATFVIPMFYLLVESAAAKFGKKRTTTAPHP